MKTQIAQRLTDLRGSRSRHQIAEAVGVSLSAILMYENGFRVPRDEIKMRIAKYYNVSVEELFFCSENHKK